MFADILFLGFSSDVWHSQPTSRPLSQIATDARGAARRLAKGADAVREAARFHKLHSWLETTALVLRAAADVEEKLVGARGEVDTYLRWLESIAESGAHCDGSAASPESSVFVTFRLPEEVVKLATSLKESFRTLENASERSLFARIVSLLERCDAGSLALVSVLYVAPSAVKEHPDSEPAYGAPR